MEPIDTMLPVLPSVFDTKISYQGFIQNEIFGGGQEERGIIFFCYTIKNGSQKKELNI